MEQTQIDKEIRHFGRKQVSSKQLTKHIEPSKGSFSRFLQCSGPQGSLGEPNNDSISVNQEFLQQIDPMDIATEPLVEFQAKPEIDLLAKANIRKKQYESLIQQHQLQKQAEHKKAVLSKVNSQAKEIIQKCKKVPQTAKAKWGHTPFVPTRDKENQQEQNKACEKKNQQRPKVELKPINQRISQYKKTEQLLKIKSEEDLKRTHRKDVDIQGCSQKIQANAQKILEEIKAQKEKAKEEKRIVNAKIRALQIQSLQKVAQAKKRPLQAQAQFSLGDSVYSTFDARAEGRKSIKPNKKKGKINPPAEPTLQETRKSKYSSKRASQRPASGSRSNQGQTTLRQKPQGSDRSAGQGRLEGQGVAGQAAQAKGPFFIWNIPIMPEDLSKLEKNSKDVFMNVDRFNYKSGKTFREEANEYLSQKLERRMQVERQQMKQQCFLMEVSRKKQSLEREFSKAESQRLSEVVWNEDEVFRPNSLENFHFYQRNP